MSSGERLDRLPLARFHYVLLLICGLGTLFDAVDATIIASILPVLGREWRLQPSEVGLIGSAGNLGLFVGAVVSGLLADRWGRRGVFQFTVAWFSLLSLACAFAWGLQSMLMFRFLVGLGLGGEVPVVAAYFSELVPAANRGKLVTLYMIFFPMGVLVASLAGFLLIGTLSLSWRWLFVLGTLPCLYVMVIRRSLPESPRWLEQKGFVERARHITTAIESRVAGAPNHLITDASSAKSRASKTASGVRNLFSGPYLPRTLMLWVVWFGVYYATYGFLIWQPTLLSRSGLPVTAALGFSVLTTLMYLPGYLIIAWVIDRAGRKRPFLISLAGLAIAAVFFGLNGNKFGPALIVWACLYQFGIGGCQAVIYTYSPELYPTDIRATGVSWASAAGRAAAVIAPAMIGFLLTTYGTVGPFSLAAAAVVIAFMFLAWLGPETKQLRLEEAAA